jgi:Family of unknown function (DUF6488)
MKYVLPLVTLFLSTNALASAGSSCHFHGNQPAAESTVVECAIKKKESLLEKGKLDISWKAISHEKIEQISSKKGKKEWKLTYTDSTAKDPKKSKLYLFFSNEGNFLAANHTGE